MNQLLQKLLDKETLPIGGNKYYLSAYIPFDDSSRDKFNTHIKSSLLKAFREHKKLADKTQLHENIVNEVFKRITPFIYLEKGVGIFVKFDAADQNKQVTKSNLDEKIDIITFSIEPKEEVYIGYTYNLYQLVWLTKNNIEALVVSLSREKSSVYEIDGTQINQLKTFTDKHIPKEKHYSRVYAPVGGKLGNIHGTGKSKVEKSEIKSSKLFLKEIASFVYSDERREYDYLVVIHSDPFIPFVEEAFKDSDRYKVIFVNKSLQDAQEILELAKVKIKELQKTTKKDDLTIARENFELYSEGWSGTIKAIERGQVQKLLIKTGVTKEGYIDPKSKKIYIYPTEDAVNVENIIPWLIKLTKDNGGSIVVFSTSKYKDIPEIAAQLRFKN